MFSDWLLNINIVTWTTFFLANKLKTLDKKISLTEKKKKKDEMNTAFHMKARVTKDEI